VAGDLVDAVGGVLGGLFGGGGGHTTTQVDHTAAPSKPVSGSYDGTDALKAGVGTGSSVGNLIIPTGADDSPQLCHCTTVTTNVRPSAKPKVKTPTAPPAKPKPIPEYSVPAANQGHLAPPTSLDWIDQTPSNTVDLTQTATAVNVAVSTASADLGLAGDAPDLDTGVDPTVRDTWRGRTIDLRDNRPDPENGPKVPPLDPRNCDNRAGDDLMCRQPLNPETLQEQAREWLNGHDDPCAKDIMRGGSVVWSENECGQASAPALGDPAKATEATGGSSELSEAFSYTYKTRLSRITTQGLPENSFATPTGGLSPLQAQLELSLPPDRALPNAVVRIDLAGLRQAGYEIPAPTRVGNVVRGIYGGRVYSMPGGGWEMQFPFQIPPEFLKVVEFGG
jgi:hypothetical protein